MSKRRRGFHITCVRSEPIGQSESSIRRPQSHDALGHRFRVVRLNSRGRYTRGRWTCIDLPQEVGTLGVGLRRVMMIDSLRHAHSLESLELIGREQEKEVVRSGPPSPTVTTHRSGHAPRQHKPCPLQLRTDAQNLRLCRSQPSSPPHSLNHSLFSSAHSSSCTSSIDTKIEQALDLVKTHLRMAVRDEVQVLRETIRDLQNQNQLLQEENRILKTITHTY